MKHGTKIVKSFDLMLIWGHILQNHPHFCFFLPEIMPISYNFGKF